MKSTTYQIINKTAIPGGTLHDALLWLYSNGGGGGVSDHGLLTGLGDDDHTQYFNQTRGDTRYSLVTHGHSLAGVGSAGFMSASDFSKLAGIAAGATANTGTVTSVGVSGGTTGLSFTGGPVTTSGTLTLTGTLAVANGGTGTTTATGSGSVVLSASPTLTGTANVENLNLSGTGKRITGDFSNATIANRVMFQGNNASLGTVVSAVTGLTGQAAGFNVYGNTDVNNSSIGSLTIIDGTDVRLVAGRHGTGAFLPLTTYVGGAQNTQQPAAGGLLVNGGALGYGAGAGGTVTQTTNKGTAVTLNKRAGLITTSNASLAAGASVTFLVTNSSISAEDTVVVNLLAGYGNFATYRVMAEAVLNGGFYITLTNISGGALAEALNINFYAARTART